MNIRKLFYALHFTHERKWWQIFMNLIIASNRRKRRKNIVYVTFDNKDAIFICLMFWEGCVFLLGNQIEPAAFIDHFVAVVDRCVIVVCKSGSEYMRVWASTLFLLHLYVCQFQFPLMISLWIVFSIEALPSNRHYYSNGAGDCRARISIVCVWWRALGCNVKHKTIIFVSCFVIITKVHATLDTTSNSHLRQPFYSFAAAIGENSYE